MLLSTLLAEPRSCYPFLLLQSTAAQSIFPLLRALCTRPTVHTICFSLLYAPSTLVNSSSAVIDWTAQIPGYSSSYDFQAELFAKVNSAPRDRPLAVVMDSLEILSENLASSMEVYEFLHRLLRIITSHPCPSQLIIHSVKPENIADLLLQTSFSSLLVNLKAHAISLFLHLSKEYMISPPPVTPEPKFWSIFIPLSERLDEIERLSFGPQGEGSGCNREMIIEILARGINTQAGKRGAERVLEGWNATRNMPCSLPDLQSLKSLFSQKELMEAAPDPTQNLSFNLSLSESQQRSRAEVPLPYAHEGQRIDMTRSHTGVIFYDPDSADDIDDDDPDDDLDI